MKVRIDMETVRRTAREAGVEATDRIRRATGSALVKVARKAAANEVKVMRTVFDRPTPWTLNAITVGQQIDAENLTVSVETRGGYWARSDHYLATQMAGGSSRPLKAFERNLQHYGVMPSGWYAVPGQRAKLNAYGNQSPAELRQILSWFDSAERVAGSTQNMGIKGRDRRRKGTKRKAGWEYIVVRPGDRRRFVRGAGGVGAKGLQPGIYRRTYLALGTRVEPIVIFVKAATYRARFPFVETVERTVSIEFEPALADSLARRRP